jgi:hypothetical protein
MANHSSACSSSSNLCEQLFDTLSQTIPNLTYKQGNNKCSFGVTGGRKIFAWVNSHHSRYRRVNVWFLGDLSAAANFTKLTVNPRNKTEGSWAEYRGSFMIEHDDQLVEAAKLLATVSYPASIR